MYKARLKIEYGKKIHCDISMLQSRSACIIVYLLSILMVAYGDC